MSDIYVVVERDSERPEIVGPFENFPAADEWAGQMRQLTEDVPGWDWYPRDGQTALTPDEAAALIRQRVRGERL